MKKLLCLLPFVLLGCSVMQPTNPVTLANEQTVALKSPDTWDVFCSAVWVGPKWVLTAEHCTYGESDAPLTMVPIEDHSHAQFEGEVTFRDAEHDLALIHVAEPPANHAVAYLAEQNPQVGDPIHIVGHPSGMTWTYVTGTVAAYRNATDFPTDFQAGLVEDKKSGPWMQVAAPVWYGNSGGGVFDSNNCLVGIASFKLKMPNSGFYVGLETLRSFVQAHTS